MSEIKNVVCADCGERVSSNLLYKRFVLSSPDHCKFCGGWSIKAIYEEKSPSLTKAFHAIDEYTKKLNHDLKEKFKKGAEEHGDFLSSEIDFEKEIYNEELDLINYKLMKQIKEKK